MDPTPNTTRTRRLTPRELLACAEAVERDLTAEHEARYQHWSPEPKRKPKPTAAGAGVHSHLIRENVDAASDARFRLRQAIVDADPTLDPRLRALLLDRTRVPTAALKPWLGMEPQRVSRLRHPRGKPFPHPGIFPPLDELLKIQHGKSTGRVLDAATEIGAAVHWGFLVGKLIWDPELGKPVIVGQRIKNAADEWVTPDDYLGPRHGRRAVT